MASRNMHHVLLRWFLWGVVIQGSALLIAWQCVATEEMQQLNWAFLLVGLFGIWIGAVCCKNLYETGLLRLESRDLRRKDPSPLSE